jgi:small nuclear ribonucleoprotein (snRNP)-like protein
MEKQLVPALAVFVFCLLYTVAIAAQAKSHASPDKAREHVQQLGLGKRVKVKLQNGLKIRGRITGFAGDKFVVTDSATGERIQVAYADVADIRKEGIPRFFNRFVVGFAVTAAVVASLAVIIMSIPD